MLSTCNSASSQKQKKKNLDGAAGELVGWWRLDDHIVCSSKLDFETPFLYSWQKKNAAASTA